jgi:hypothetical protein
MRTIIALALSFSCVGLVAVANPACSSSSPNTSTDSGPKPDSSPRDSGTETTPMDSPTGCTSPADAAGLLGAAACSSCIATMCGSTNLVEQCGCEPDCIKALECLDLCVMDGGSAAGCAIPCLEKEADSAATQATGGAILSCVGTTSMSPCNTACKTTSTSEAGSEGGSGDAGGDGGDAS